MQYYPLSEGDEEADVGSLKSMGISEKGVTRIPQFSYVIFACTEELTVPWDALEPFLSGEGKKVRDSLR